MVRPRDTEPPRGHRNSGMGLCPRDPPRTERLRRGDKTSSPHRGPDPATPAPNWPGPQDPSAKLARTPDPGPRTEPRTTRRFWAFGAHDVGSRLCLRVFLCSTRLSNFPPLKTLQKQSPFEGPGQCEISLHVDGGSQPAWRMAVYAHWYTL